ncbi:TorD/DmsD family molecular chaperone [Bacillus sp. FJAT-18017]|uniref:TorD/DmsD family molecular chaperone n=1 Tax=Bacillus sp. FJAT-18017 TaxID=1705566 RepID=UPI0006AFC983|nr:molecular chaperone TorD family protein [Bacillus sp. FJAT-18017]
MNEAKSLADDQNSLLTRYYMNSFLRFLLDAAPDIDRAEALNADQNFHILADNSEGGALIKEFLLALNQNPEKVIQEGRDEFNSLFVGPNVLPAPPWESVYLGREHLLFEEQTLKVRESYKTYGLSFIRENNEPEDHILIELEFLAHMILMTLNTEEKDIRMKLLADQAAFLDAHFLRWAPKFSDLFEKNAKTLWFKGASVLLEEYISLEEEIAVNIKEALNHE